MNFSTRVGAVSAAVAISAASLLAMLPAAAATTDISSNLTGSLAVQLGGAGNTLDLGVPAGSSFTGTFDDATGDLTGNVKFAAGNGVVTSPIPGSIGFFMVETGKATGTIAADNTVTFTDTQTLKLHSYTIAGLPPSVDLGDHCALGPIEMTYTGTYDPTTGVVKLTSASAPVPAPTDDGCDALPEPIQELLPGSQMSASLQFKLAGEDIEGQTTTSTVAPPTTVPAQSAPAARSVTKTPTYTG